MIVGKSRKIKKNVCMEQICLQGHILKRKIREQSGDLQRELFSFAFHLAQKKRSMVFQAWCQMKSSSELEGKNDDIVTRNHNQSCKEPWGNNERQPLLTVGRFRLDTLWREMPLGPEHNVYFFTLQCVSLKECKVVSQTLQLRSQIS